MKFHSPRVVYAWHLKDFEKRGWIVKTIKAEYQSMSFEDLFKQIELDGSFVDARLFWTSASAEQLWSGNLKEGNRVKIAIVRKGENTKEDDKTKTEAKQAEVAAGGSAVKADPQAGIHKLAKELFKQFGIEEYKFYRTKTTSRLGYCDYRTRTITVSLYNTDDWEDTLRHEIAHAVQFKRDGYSDHHGKRWQEVCLEVGAEPKRCGHMEVPHKYKLVCNECGETYLRNKKMFGYRCGKCKGSLNLEVNLQNAQTI